MRVTQDAGGSYSTLIESHDPDDDGDCPPVALTFHPDGDFYLIRQHTAGSPHVDTILLTREMAERLAVTIKTGLVPATKGFNHGHH